MKYLMLDTETTNSIDDPICYDVGFSVIDENGKVYATYSFVVADTFLDKELMESAFFKDKIPAYWNDIKSGKRSLRRFSTIRKIVKEVMRENGIDTVIAHNARFDYRSTNLTMRYLTKSKYRFFFPYGTKFLDTLKMARSVFGEDTEYIDFCTENGYNTKANKPRFTAEILYRFLTGNLEFVESHTGLEDTLIEGMIFTECRNRKPNVNGNLWD